MVPLFEGPLSRDVINARQPIKELIRRINSKKIEEIIRLADGCAALVRVLNPLVKDLTSTEQDNYKQNINNTFLNEILACIPGGNNKSAKYLFDEFKYSDTKTISDVIPKVGDQRKVMKYINAEIATKTGIRNYAL